MYYVFVPFYSFLGEGRQRGIFIHSNPVADEESAGATGEELRTILEIRREIIRGPVTAYCSQNGDLNRSLLANHRKVTINNGSQIGRDWGFDVRHHDVPQMS